MTSVLTTVDALSPHWDWYAASLPSDVDESVVRSVFAGALGGEPRAVRGAHGYESRWELMHGKRRAVAVSYGGAQPRVLVEGTGVDSEAVAGILRRNWPAHRVVRADSALDFDSPTAFEDVQSLLRRVALDRGLKTELSGDWIRGRDGRSLYVGGRYSEVRVVGYEKGKQLPEAERPNWVRCELRVRPKKAMRERVAALSPSAVWGTAQWSKLLWEELGGPGIESVKLPRWSLPDGLRARNALVKQYYGYLEEWAEEVGGWEALGPAVREWKLTL